MKRLSLLLLACFLFPAGAAAADRPPIVGIANFVVKTDTITEARKFYSGVLGYDEAFTHKRAGVASDVVSFKVNDRQYIEVSQTLQDEADDKLIQIGYETSNARQLRDYLAEKGVKVPAKVETDPDGNLSFVVMDPEDHRVEFVQYMPGSVQSKTFGKLLSAKRISDHMLHVGIHIQDEKAADGFYKDILGFRPLWKGGNSDDRFEWISLLVPDGNNWVEYMMWKDTPPDPKRLGVLHHVCVGTHDIQATYKTVQERGYEPPRAPNVARDGRWLLHLFDKHNTRTEVMIRKPVEKPCCSELTDPYE
jgi:lactoylglutathione lyase